MQTTQKRKKPQISFRIDHVLKEELVQKIKKHRLNLTEFFKFCIEAYLDNEITIGVMGDDDTPPKHLLKQFKTKERILLSEAAWLLKRIRTSSRREMKEEIKKNRPI